MIFLNYGIKSCEHLCFKDIIRSVLIYYGFL